MTSGHTVENLIIVGSGPAAFSACITTQALAPLLFEGTFTANMFPGGQLMTTTDVDNYPGFPLGIKGPRLIENMRSQIKTRVVSQRVEAVEACHTAGVLYYRVATDKGVFYAYAVIVATGALARRLYVPGTNDGEYWQRGVSACAVCDGWAFKDKSVVVVGGGDSAMEEARHLSRIAARVYLVHRSVKFRAKKDMLDKVLGKANVELVAPYALKEVLGGKKMERVVVYNTATMEERVLDAEGLFFGIGHDPNSQVVAGCADREDDLYIKTDASGATSSPGLFACGDVQDRRYRQAVTAAASGALVGITAIKYLETKNLNQPESNLFI